MCKIKNLVKQYFRDVAELEYKPFLNDSLCELLRVAKHENMQLYEQIYNLVHSNKLDDKYKREHTIFVHLSDYINIDECTQDIMESIIYNRDELYTRDIKELEADFVEDIIKWCNEKIEDILQDSVYNYLVADSMTYTYEYDMLISVGSCYANEHIESLQEYGMNVSMEDIAYEFLRSEYAQTIIDSFTYSIEEKSDYLQEELLKHYCKSYTAE